MIAYISREAVLRYRTAVPAVGVSTVTCMGTFLCCAVRLFVLLDLCIVLSSFCTMVQQLAAWHTWGRQLTIQDSRYILSYELRINECLLVAFLSAKHKSLCPRHELGCYEMHGGCYFVAVVRLGSKLIVFCGCFTMLW